MVGINYSVFIAAALLLGGGCGRDVGPAELPKINPLRLTQRVSDFGGRIAHIEPIPLVTPDSVVVTGITKILTDQKGGFVVLDKAHVYAFDRRGNLSMRYGNMGRGPGEYLKISDICLGKNQTELWCLNHMNEVLAYDLATGRYLGSVSTHSKERHIPPASAVIPAQNDGFYLFIPNPNDAADRENPFYCLKEFDSVGQPVGESLLRSDFNIGFNMIPFVTQSRGNTYLLRPQENENICYSFSGAAPVEWLKIHFGADNIPPLFSFQSDRNPWLNLERFMNSDYYKSPFSILQTQSQLFLSAFGPKGEIAYFVIDWESKRGVNWMSGVGSPVSPFFILCSDEEAFYGVFDKYILPDNRSEIADPLLRCLVAERGLHLDEDGNPILVRIEFAL